MAIISVRPSLKLKPSLKQLLKQEAMVDMARIKEPDRT
jgi:hypothetical protein